MTIHPILSHLNLRGLNFDNSPPILVGSQALGMENDRSDWDFIFKQDHRPLVVSRLDHGEFHYISNKFGTITIRLNPYIDGYSTRVLYQLIFLNDANYRAWDEAVKLMNTLPEDTKQFFKENKEDRISTFQKFVVHFGGDKPVYEQ